jgi:metallo-beta-lactamase family protein
MRIQFCGADRTVTGSSHLIEINGKRILLDCGMYQGDPHDAERLNHYLPDNPAKIDVVILSHGHLDHCGKLPVLYRAGYRGPIYCTPATQGVTMIVLYDAAKIQQENADYLNRQSKTAPPVMYDANDVAATLALMKNVEYGQSVKLFDGIEFTFLDAGHILGSTYVLLECQEISPSPGNPGEGRGGGYSEPRTQNLELTQNPHPTPPPEYKGREDEAAGNKMLRRHLLFTADVGRYNSPILRDPTVIPTPCDVIITESTYGNSLHGPMENVEPQFLDAVKFCIDRRSRLLIPSFAVGRTQTVLWYIQKFISEKKIPPIPVYVDSPMGVEVSKLHSQYRDAYDEETTRMIGAGDLFSLAHVTFASSVEDSKKINADSGPCVIIASSPSCDFGRILHHLKHSVSRPNDLVTFVGWIPPQTLGRRLQDGEKRVQILHDWYQVRCQVRTIHGLSAHADAAELMQFLKPALTKDSKVFVVHGEVPQGEALANSIRETGTVNVSLPTLGSSVEL